MSDKSEEKVDTCLIYLWRASKTKSKLLAYLISPLTEIKCATNPIFRAVFADASQIAYGVVSYLRITNAQGLIHCSFVIGKSQLSPLKHLTIPRLELSAAVVAARLDKIIRTETDLQVDKSVFWTDSTCVLGYLRNESKLSYTFVANWVATIQEVVAASLWRHVDSSQNPADDASRGLSAEALLNNSGWLRGPDFLWHPESSWPIAPGLVLEVSPDDPEVK